MMAVGTLKRYSQYIPETDNPRLIIVEHFDTVVRDHVDVLLRSAKVLLNLVKKRIGLEKDRIKALVKLSSSIFEESKNISLDGVLKESWDHIKQHSQQESMHRSNILTSLEEKVVQPLSVFLLSDLEKRYQNINSDVQHKVKEYHQMRSQVQKAKERYFILCAEWESQLMLIYKESGSLWEPVIGNKLYEKEQQICKKVDEARIDYESHVERLNANVQALTLQHLPQALSSLQDTTEQMVSVVHTALKNFEMLQLSLVGKIPVVDTSSACEEFFIVPEFCQTFIFKSFDLESPPLPPSFDFEEYTYKDSAYELQARKTQYRAMSLLSPSELATRGAMYLGGSGKGGSGGKGNGALPVVKLEGINSHLIKVCVEYLCQPIALNEEGIFRVPGDTSIIRSLHSDFMTAGQDEDKLKFKVMDQKDPNNISGLLKLHLRENSLLSKKVMAHISGILSSPPQQNIEIGSLILKELIDHCSAVELNLLTMIINMLSTIVSEPYKVQNKMTARTLGIACGLSLFPQLDPGQATRLLEILIKHLDQLQLVTPPSDGTEQETVDH